MKTSDRLHRAGLCEKLCKCIKRRGSDWATDGRTDAAWSCTACEDVIWIGTVRQMEIKSRGCEKSAWSAYSAYIWRVVRTVCLWCVVCTVCIWCVVRTVFLCNCVLYWRVVLCTVCVLLCTVLLCCSVYCLCNCVLYWCVVMCTVCV
jgi:hypothetical protein